MWRRYGDDLYALLVLVVFSLEALTLGILTWGFAAGAARALSAGDLTAILVAAVAITALLLVTVGSYILGYHVVSTRRERGRRERLETWTSRWIEVLFHDQSPPRPPLPSEAVESLLDLREILTGNEGDSVERLVRRYRIGQRLLERTEAVDAGRRGLGRVVASLRYRRLSARLEALEALSKARLALSVDPLLNLLQDREPSIRLMAIRSLARSLARMREGRARDRASRRFAEAVLTADLPPGVVEEALLLLEDAAPRVIGLLLAAAQPKPKGVSARKVAALLQSRPEDQQLGLVAKAMDAVGRLKLLELAEDVVAHVGHTDPELRSAALRTLGRLGILPEGSEEGVAAALQDEVEHVRVQAARTAVLLTADIARPALWQLLGDDSWWVRRAAANALFRLGPEGPAALEQAGRTHPDRYARQMALQVLLDEGWMDADRARALRGAV
jgi:HEAT repeat protein